MSAKKANQTKTFKEPPEPWPNKAASKDQRMLWDKHWPLIKFKQQGNTIDPTEVEKCCKKMLQVLNPFDDRWKMLLEEPNKKKHKLYNSLFNYVMKKITSK